MKRPKNRLTKKFKSLLNAEIIANDKKPMTLVQYEAIKKNALGCIIRSQ